MMSVVALGAIVGEDSLCQRLGRKGLMVVRIAIGCGLILVLAGLVVAWVPGLVGFLGNLRGK